jgi:hypothetical protein
MTDTRNLILYAEIAVLLHDIGKFSKAFLFGKDKTSPHTSEFRDPSKELCNEVLLKVLEKDLPNSILTVTDRNTQLKAIGDLQLWHHSGSGLYKYFGVSKKTQPPFLPMLLYLTMYADTIDSATSKGGAAWKKPKDQGEARRSMEENEQDASFFHLASPFGTVEKSFSILNTNVFDSKRLLQDKDHFQNDLAKKLGNFIDPSNNYSNLLTARKVLIDCIEYHLTGGIADTRLPSNDVSLWQHSSSTASLFKAMLASHLFTEKLDYCDPKTGNLTHYREALAILGIRWSEDQLIARSFRTAEILGRRKRLDEAAENIKTYVETEICLGNEIYRDRDGIYFLVPKKVDIPRDILESLGDTVDSFLNDENALGGELAWEARSLDVGLQITRLPEVFSGSSSTELLASGPKNPKWSKLWNSSMKTMEICPRCGKRPVESTLVVTGSAGDAADKICGQCLKYTQEGVAYRNNAVKPGGNSADRKQRRRLLAADEGIQYLIYDINTICQKDQEGTEEDNRLALIQGILDLRPMLSGTAFSSILVSEPPRYSVVPGGKDESLNMSTWDEMLSGCKTSWDHLKQTFAKTEHIHTLQQIFYDSMLCTMGDGRADGQSDQEKGLNFLRNTVLKAPFSPHLMDEHAKLVNYALRQHPAPSRLARIWNATLEFNQFPMRWCEQNKIHYFPVTIDPGRFMVLLPASKALEMLHALHNEYQNRYSRVQHILPLHLSATVFYHKSPLYIGIDSARRLGDIGLCSTDREQLWAVVEKIEEAEFTFLTLFSTGKTIRLSYPRKLENGQDDRYFPWFWLAGNPLHPIHLDDLKIENQIYLYASTFDYEVLDSTTRRYDIRIIEKGRPHMMVQGGGPRPYNLDTLRQWQEIAGPLGRIESAQLKHLVELLATVHQRWMSSCFSNAYNRDLANLARDAMKQTLSHSLWNQHGETLCRMACDGSFFDLVEWLTFISK